MSKVKNESEKIVKKLATSDDLDIVQTLDQLLDYLLLAYQYESLMFKEEIHHLQ